MKNLLIATVLFVLVGFAWAGRPETPPAPQPVLPFAVVTYTPTNGSPPWIDSGIIVRDLQFSSPTPGYTIRSIFFTDHQNGYHLDEGTVEVVYK